MNLIWICRDAALIEHFLQSVEEFKTNGGLLIYYTGKRRLFLNDDLPPDVFIFEGRPNLEMAISAIIYSTASGDDLPESLFLNNSSVSKASTEDRAKLLIERAISIYTLDQLFEYAVHASSDRENGAFPLLGSASFDGVILMMENLLGDEFELLRERIIKSLDTVDTFGSALLDEDMFEDFFRLILEGQGLYDENEDSTKGTTRDSDTRLESLAIHDKSFGINTFLQGDGKFSSSKWKLLYCGGSNALKSQLKTYKQKYSIDLSVEKFDW
jgi:hypothetical protein